MAENLDEQQLELLASQLSCPSGDQGVKTAENMAINNSGMILSAIRALSLQNGDAVLEIGPGSGRHLPLLFEEAADLVYQGVDISELMVAEASKLNKDLLERRQAQFLLSDGERLDFADRTFDKIFTVNTLYFWKDSLAYAREIERVLKPDGIFCLCFAPKEFMAKLPFTNYIFKLYTLDDAEKLLEKAGFRSLLSVKHTEVVRVSAEENIEREFIVITAKITDGRSAQ